MNKPPPPSLRVGLTCFARLKIVAMNEFGDGRLTVQCVDAHGFPVFTSMFYYLDKAEVLTLTELREQINGASKTS